MNQKDYKAISEIIAIKGSSESKTTKIYRKFLVTKLADYFNKEEESNPPVKLHKFNREQFLKNCGVN